MYNNILMTRMIKEKIKETCTKNGKKILKMVVKHGKSNNNTTTTNN